MAATAYEIVKDFSFKCGIPIVARTGRKGTSCIQITMASPKSSSTLATINYFTICCFLPHDPWFSIGTQRGKVAKLEKQ